MNPLFGGQIGQIMQAVNAVRQIRQDPTQLGQFLKDRGVINDQQYQDIQKYGGNVDQIGQYLINNNIMSQQQAANIYQTAYPSIRQALTK